MYASSNASNRSNIRSQKEIFHYSKSNLIKVEWPDFLLYRFWTGRPLNPELEILYFSMIGPGSVSIKSDSTRIRRLVKFVQVSETDQVLVTRTETWTFEVQKKDAINGPKRWSLALTTREVGSALFSSILISVASSCLLQIFFIDLILSPFALSLFIKSFAIIRFKIKIEVRIAFRVCFRIMSEGLSFPQFKSTDLIHSEVLDTFFSSIWKLKPDFGKTFILDFLKI